MWLASGDSIMTANLWWFLGSVSIALISATVTVYTLRSRPKEAPSRGETAKVVDDAVDVYRRLIVKPMQTERDDYRSRWLECEEGKRHD